MFPAAHLPPAEQEVLGFSPRRLFTRYIATCTGLIRPLVSVRIPASEAAYSGALRLEFECYRLFAWPGHPPFIPARANPFPRCCVLRVLVVTAPTRNTIIDRGQTGLTALAASVVYQFVFVFSATQTASESHYWRIGAWMPTPDSSSQGRCTLRERVSHIRWSLILEASINSCMATLL